MKKKTYLILSLTAVLTTGIFAFLFSTGRKTDDHTLSGEHFITTARQLAQTAQIARQASPPTCTTPKTTFPHHPEKKQGCNHCTWPLKKNGHIIWITAFAPDKTPLKLPDTTNYISWELSLNAVSAYLITRDHNLPKRKIRCLPGWKRLPPLYQRHGRKRADSGYPSHGHLR